MSSRERSFDRPTMQSYPSKDFERIAMVHAESLLRVARRMTGDNHAAEDAAQEALLSAWRSFHTFEEGTNCRAWLFKILINLLHKNRSRPQLVMVDLPEATVLENIVPIRSTYADLAQSEAVAAINALSPEQREVLLLAVVEGFTCKEIGAMLDLPIGTVMSRLSRGRVEVRNALQSNFTKQLSRKTRL